MNVFEFIRNNIAIETVVSQYTALKKMGGYLKGACPFHSERTASFTVTPHKGIFYCFGCHVTGDTVAFIAKVEQCSQIEAAQLLADRFGLTIPEELQQQLPQQRDPQEKQRYFTVMQTVQQWCMQELAQQTKAKEYLATRGLSPAIIARYRLGYFPAGATALKRLGALLQQAGFLLQDLIPLAILNERNRQLHSPFEERIIFPIHDHLGRCVAFGGRVFLPHDDRSKYYNSRENEHFTKGNLLYGLAMAKPAMQAEKHAFLVEGYMDCLTMVQYGYEQTVATLGTAVTPEHLKLLGRHIDQLYVLFDGDNAGQQAMMRLTQLCWDVNIDLKVVVLPSQEDPASYLQQYQTVAEPLKSAQDIFSFFISRASRDYQRASLKQKLATVHDILRAITMVDDELKRAVLLQLASQQTGLPFATLQRACHTTGNHQPAVADESVESMGLSSIPDVEQVLIAACLQDQSGAAMVGNDPITQLFVPQTVALLYALQNPLVWQQQICDIAKVPEPHTLLLQQIVARHQAVIPLNQALAQCYRLYWKRLSDLLKQEIAQAQQNQDKERVDELLTQLQQLKTSIMSRQGAL